MLIGLAEEEPPDKEDAEGIAEGYRHLDGRLQHRRREADDEGPQEEGQDQKELVENIKKQVPGGDEVGKGQDGLGVVVGGEEEFCLLRVAGQDVPAVPAALLHLGGIACLLQHTAEPKPEGLLLPGGLADLPAVQ